jgi:serine/threonine protein kinase
MLSNKYKLIQKINQGAFGSIYKAENVRTKELVAIKFESKTSQIKSLKNEAKIYQYLGKLDGFPELKWFGTNDKTTYLVIDLLGKSLSDTITYFKALSLKTVLVYGIQMIKRIQVLHEKLLLHRDIKPSNFVSGLGTSGLGTSGLGTSGLGTSGLETSSDLNKLHLVDFGFAKRYDFNGIHIEEKNIKHIVGSINFVSLNVHNLIEPSRRDDIESCIYIILTMLFGKLEWFDKTDINEIYYLKTNIVNLEEVPSFIKIILYYVRSMTFDEKPDYEYIINLMVNEFNKNGFKNDEKFEWS